MRTPKPAAPDHFEPLEPRRLLSLTPVGPEITVPFPIEMSQFDMAVAGDGSFIVVGDPIEQPGSPDVVAIRYSPDGEQVGPALRLDDRGFNVSVSADADGDAVVAYQKGSDGVYVVRVSKEGVATSPQRVATAPADNAVYEAAVSVDDGGGFFVAWLERARVDRFLFPNATLQVRAFDAGGAPRGPQFGNSTGSGFFSLGGLDIAAHPDGSGAVFAYTHSQESGAPLRVARVSTEGFVGASNFISDVVLSADVAVHADGSYVVGYERQATDVDFSIQSSAFAQRYDAAGDALGPEIALGASLPGEGVDQRIESVAVDALPDGGFVATFLQWSDDGPTTYSLHYDATGAPLGGPEAVDTGPAWGHVIGSSGGGDLVLAYLDGPLTEDSFDATPSGSVRVRRLAISVADLRGSELYILGTDADDHIIVERVRENLFVNVNGIVDRFNAADVQHLSINGFGGDDDIDNATAIPSTIHGGDGVDTLWGGIGPDRLRGLGGDDVLHGGDGNDTVLGDSGSDAMNGGDGDDDLLGDIGEDTLYGSSGGDLLRGDRGSDSLYGEAGNDTLEGGAGGDYFEGGAGDDALTGGGEADALFGLAGNDRLFSAGDGIRDTVRGGPGTDSGDVDGADDVLAVEALA